MHFGLDPLNRSSALTDEDFDGWDSNLDGVLSPDVSRTETALALGEQLSNIEEYNIYFDDGNKVIAGLKSIKFDAETSSLFTYPISFSTDSETLSIIHHDIRELESVGERIYITTKYGITVFDYGIGSSVDYWMPQGVILEDSELLFDSEEELTQSQQLQTSV